MSSSIFIEGFLLTDVFFMGGLAVVAYQHWRAHYGQPHQPPTPPRKESFRLPDETRQRLMHQAQERFESVINNSSDKLHHDLELSADHINRLVVRLATDIVSTELERYRQELLQLQKQAQGDLSGIKQQVAGHQVQIEAKIAQELQAEKLRLLKQIDTKLADAVGSFLLETLQHEVDLGGQGPYLIEQLEAHKAEFSKELMDDSRSA